MSKNKILLGISNKKILLCTLFSVVCVITFFIGAIFVPKTQASEYVGILQSDTTIEEKYSLGTEFKIPKGNISLGDDSYSAEAYYLKTPNGTIYSGTEHTLDELGIYTVIYSAKKGASLITAEQSFIVVQGMYETSSNFSTAEYSEELVRPDSTKYDTQGLQVSLVDGDSFSFNEPINLTQTAEFFSFYPYATVFSNVETPSYKNGGYTYDIDANSYIIRLTDCYDSSNYVEIELAVVVANRLEVPYSYNTYCRAGAGSSVKAGLEVVAEDKVISSQASEARIDGVRYQVWHSAYGTSGRRGSIEKLPACSLKFDVDTGCVYLSYGTGWSLINDLDNVDVNGTDAFQGFKTNEVYLSVYASDYLRETANFEISKIVEYENSALNFTEEYKDETIPNLVIDVPFDITEKYYIALGEELMVFDAYAMDVNLVGDISVRVFYEYDTDRPTQVFLQDGKFTPLYEGDYTIVYSAVDASGNVAQKNVTFKAIECEHAVSLETENISSLQAGTICSLPEYKVKTINGEAVEVSIYAIFDGDEENKVSIDIEKMQFLVENVGRYEIRYVCKGLLTTTEYSYTVDSVSAGNIRIDNSNAYLPKYFVNGASYTLDEVCAYSYTEKNPTRLECKYFVSEDENSEREINPEDYTVQASNMVRFKYVCENVVAYSETVQVVDVGFAGSLSMEKYFVGDVSKESKSTSIAFTANAEFGNVSMQFINVLSLNSFSIALKIPSDKAEYQAFVIVLRDLYDENISYTLRYAKNENGNMSLSVNNGTATDLGISFTHSSYTTVSYDSGTNKFSVIGGPEFTCYAAFTTDRVSVEMTFEGIDGIAGVEISNLCSQRLSKTVRDSVSPYIGINNDEKGERAINTVITLSTPSVCDVLSPYLKKNISLKCVLPSGDYAVSLDGVKLDGTCSVDREYQFVLNAYGSYRVEYSYKDQAGNVSSASYAIYVSDRTAPTLSIKGNYDETTVLKKSKGSSYTIVGYTVDDNFGADGLTVWVMVISPMNKMTITDAGDKIQLDEVGRWKICYYCQDAEFNYTVRYYYIDVQ